MEEYEYCSCLLEEIYLLFYLAEIGGRCRRYTVFLLKRRFVEKHSPNLTISDIKYMD